MELLAHGCVALPEGVDMLDGYGQDDGLVDVPCRVERGIALVDDDDVVVVLAVLGAQLDDEPQAGVDGLIHQFETAVTGYAYAAVDLQLQFKEADGLAYGSLHLQ